MYKEPRQKKSTKARINSDEVRVTAVLVGDGGIGKACLNRKLGDKARPYIWDLEHWGYWELQTLQFDVSQVLSIDEIQLLSKSHPQPHPKPRFKLRTADETIDKRTIISPSSSDSPPNKIKVEERRNKDELRNEGDPIQDKRKNADSSPRIKSPQGLRCEAMQKVTTVKSAKEAKGSKEPKNPSTILLETYSIRSKTSHNIEYTLRNVYIGMSVIGLCYKVSDKETLENAVHRWFPQIRYHLPSTPVILIGCCSDLKRAAQSPNSPNYSFSEIVSVENFVSEADVLRAAREVKAVVSLECSSSDGTNLDQVLDALVGVGYNHVQAKLSPRRQHRHSFVSCRTDGCVIC